MPRALDQLRRARDSPASARFARSGGDLALWGWRLGLALEAPPGAPEPVVLELAGEWRAAIRAWRELEAPYEAALAALPGDERAARDALAALHALGASGAARAFARERASRGAPAPRGPRRTTLANAAGLTRREQEVLDQLATGATNPQIAARAAPLRAHGRASRLGGPAQARRAESCRRDRPRPRARAARARWAPAPTQHRQAGRCAAGRAPRTVASTSDSREETSWR